MHGLRTTRFISALVAAVLALNACSDKRQPHKPSVTILDAPTTAQSVPSVTKVSGNVVKGLVRNAQVNFYPVQDGERSTSVFASAVTDEFGRFELDLPAQQSSDVIYVEVVGAADGTSEMNCDAIICGTLPTLQGVDSNQDGSIGLGEVVRLSPDFKLSTVIFNFQQSETVSVSVTPLSHFAVEKAIADGSLSRENVQYYMQQIAALLNMPTTLSQMQAVDPTVVDTLKAGLPEQGGADLNAVQYGVMNSAIAGMAAQRDKTIEQTIEEVSETLYNDDDTMNREVVLELLQQSLIEARRMAKNDQSLQSLITDIQLLITRYRCEANIDDSDQCGPVVLPVPPVEPENELQTVKAFVADFRAWARDIAVQSDPAFSNFKNRTELVSNIWEDDIKELTSVLNDLLPGVAQTVSPSYRFCHYCIDNGIPQFNNAGDKVLDIYGLRYLLSSDGRMNITGTLRGVEVDVDLLLPGQYQWDETHAIEIAAGRLSKDGVDLVLTDGSRVEATYDYEWRFAQIAGRAADPYSRPPEAIKLKLDANFFVQASYSVSPSQTLSFEGGASEYAHVLDVNRWTVASNKGSDGSRSLQSNRISHFQKTRAEANFTSTGGELTFDYAVASERNFDYLNVYVDGSRILRVSGNYPQFRSARAYLSPGQHQVVFEYTKDGSVSDYSDAAWIDNISLPGLVGAAQFEELTTRNVMNGRLSIAAEKLRGPWYTSYKGFLPSDVTINAHLNSDYSTDQNESGKDEISFSFAANFANVADFVGPQVLEVDTLSKLGFYSVTDSNFELQVRDWRVEITRIDASTFRFESFDAGSAEPLEAYTAFLDTDEVHVAAGQLLSNSAIGWHVIEPEQGLYVTTLLNASPWAQYEQSQFTSDGGDIYGYLVDAFDPTETDEQYIAFAASLETTFDIDGFPRTTVGTSISRDSFKEGIFDFYVELEGSRFNVHSLYWLTPESYSVDQSVDLQDRAFSIQNQNGVTLHLNLEEPSSEGSKEEHSIKGELIFNGKVYGQIERVKGLTLIRYIDGSGESLE